MAYSEFSAEWQTQSLELSEKWILPWGTDALLLDLERVYRVPGQQTLPIIQFGLTDVWWGLTINEAFRSVIPEDSKNNKTYFLLLQVFKNKGFHNKWTEIDIKTKYFMTLIRVINMIFSQSRVLGHQWGAVILASDGHVLSTGLVFSCFLVTIHEQ